MTTKLNKSSTIELDYKEVEILFYTLEHLLDSNEIVIERLNDLAEHLDIDEDYTFHVDDYHKLFGKLLSFKQDITLKMIKAECIQKERRN